jgi:NAD(P)H-hydrate epimerase
MEREAVSFVAKRNQIYPNQNSFHILCGKENNRGDALVIARLLYDLGNVVSVVILEYRYKSSIDFNHNLKRLEGLARVDISSVLEQKHLPSPKGEDFIIDAILGSELDMPLQDLVKYCFHQINKWLNEFMSIDIPTGLFPKIQFKQ